MQPSRIIMPMLFLLLLSTGDAAAGWRVEAETGWVFPALNDVRSPGTTGTFLSLVDDLHAPSAPYFRVQAVASLGKKQSLRLMAAPLRLVSRGTLPRDTVFEGAFLPAGTPAEAYYRFDSYRATWRYSFRRSDSFEFAGGLTAKVRDAEIALTGASSGVKTNTGFVPLLHILLDWKPGAGKTGLLLEADAAAAPQGRAEDVLVALTRELRPGVSGRIGYRMLEGGADNPEVYTFAWLHYAVLGLSVDL